MKTRRQRYLLIFSLLLILIPASFSRQAKKRLLHQLASLLLKMG